MLKRFKPSSSLKTGKVELIDLAAIIVLYKRRPKVHSGHSSYNGDDGVKFEWRLPKDCSPFSSQFYCFIKLSPSTHKQHKQQNPFLPFTESKLCNEDSRWAKSELPIYWSRLRGISADIFFLFTFETAVPIFFVPLTPLLCDVQKETAYSVCSLQEYR